jgi:uncharacterized protein (DUF488 family)
MGIKKGTILWDEYEKIYSQILQERDPIHKIDIAMLERSCFLCSESTAEFCHRRLAVEYIKDKIGNVQIRHL